MLRKPLFLGTGKKSTQPYEEPSTLYDDWFKTVTENEKKCPDYQELTVSKFHNSGITFTFSGKSKHPVKQNRSQKSSSSKDTEKASKESNRDVVLQTCEHSLRPNARTGDPNGTVNFFFALTDGHHLETLTLENSVRLDVSTEENRGRLKCCVGYVPTSHGEKRSIMFKMTGEESQQVKRLLGIQHITFYIFCALKDAILDDSEKLPITINLLIVTRAHEQILKGLDRVELLKMELEKALTERTKRLDTTMLKTTMPALKQLFESTPEDFVHVAEDKSLDDMRNLVNVYEKIASTVFMKQNPEKLNPRPKKASSGGQQVFSADQTWLPKTRELMQKLRANKKNAAKDSLKWIELYGDIRTYLESLKKDEVRLQSRLSSRKLPERGEDEVLRDSIINHNIKLVETFLKEWKASNPDFLI